MWNRLVTVAGLLLAAPSHAQELLRKEREVSHHGHVDLKGEVRVAAHDPSGETAAQLLKGHEVQTKRRKRTRGVSVACSDFDGMTNTGDISNTATGLGASGGPDNSTGCNHLSHLGQAPCEQAYEINNGGKFKCVWDPGPSALGSTTLFKCKGYRAQGDWACHCPDVKRPSSESCHPIVNVYDTMVTPSCANVITEAECNNVYYEYHDLGLNVKCAYDSAKGCEGIDSRQAIVSCCYAGAAGEYAGAGGR